MRKIIALALWAGADTLELVRGGLLAAAVALLGKDSSDSAAPQFDRLPVPEDGYQGWRK